MRRYCIDTSSILHARIRAYPPEVFSALWSNLEQMIREGRLIASEEVYEELKRIDDETHEWAKRHSDMFVPTDEQVQTLAAEILERYPRLVDTRKNRSGADPFVIAAARAKDCVVVTNETRSTTPQKNPKIPNVCDDLRVECIDVLQFIKEQRWVF